MNFDANNVDFLVIGAGLAGLAFAQDRRAAGASVLLLDKGRGVGGRAATRRLGDEVRVDHGAQFFTARTPRFQVIVDTGIVEGWLAVWSYGFPLWKEGCIQERPPSHPRYAPIAGMSELPKRLANGLDIRTGATVAQIRHNPDSDLYTAYTDDGREFSGRTLILNLPPVQLMTIAGSLLEASDAARMAEVRFDPAWTLMLRLIQDVPGANWPAVDFEGHPVLGWISRDHTKRNGENPPPVLIVHGSGAWSTSHLEESKDEIQAVLLAAVTEAVGPLEVLEAQTHRWRYAQPTQPLGETCFWDSARRIGACGDWCDGARVEGALVSGWTLAEKIDD